ncbi:MAG: alanine racemase [Planctomycetes bacterium]|nr:alanine racemase [Planctomycetota bacterium]MBI3843091.1 alanine racemase [Planctomycetota bacterium]
MSHNFATVRERVGPKTKILVVVKADAYGHGALPIARRVVEDGADCLGVGDSTEALELRESGIRAPILILGAIVDGEMEQVVANDVMTCIHASQRVSLLDREARSQRKKARVHLMIDTGLGRLGVLPGHAVRLAREIALSSHLELAGVCTHLSSVYLGDEAFTRQQIGLFEKLVADIRSEGIPVPVTHAANSGAVFSGWGGSSGMVRPGVALYGLNPNGFFAGRATLRPILSLRTQIIFMKDVPKGTPIGYNRTHVTGRATRTAVIPVGYYDGLGYRLANQSTVLVRGKEAPVIGNVSMDYTTIDVGRIRGVEVGDVVTIVGRDGDLEARVETLAKAVGTIPYEITCHLGKRIRRVYTARPQASPADRRFAPIETSAPRG